MVTRLVLVVLAVAALGLAASIAAGPDPDVCIPGPSILVPTCPVQYVGPS